MEISEALSISIGSVRAFFVELGLTDTDEESADSFSVSCQELCEKVVGSFPPHQLPSASDIACIELPGYEPNCSVNVAPAELRKIKFPGGDGKGAKAHYLENKAMKNADPESPHGKSLDEKIDAHDPDVMQPIASRDIVRNAVARQFRMYPKMKPDFSEAGNVGFEMFGPDEPNVKHSRRLLDANWQQKTLNAAATGQAYIQQALTHMNSRNIPDVVIKWFGNNEDTTRNEIKRVLSGIASMLDHVEYVYPGDQCDSLTYAYVYPDSPWNKNRWTGKFLFYLCDYYMRVDQSEKIETLTHEGSHHNQMRTTDSLYDVGYGGEQPMYGRSFCETVADICWKGVQQDACDKARRNADSISFFINDAALAHTTSRQTGVTSPNSGSASGSASRATGTGGLGGLLGSLR